MRHNTEKCDAVSSLLFLGIEYLQAWRFSEFNFQHPRATPTREDAALFTEVGHDVVHEPAEEFWIHLLKPIGGKKKENLVEGQIYSGIEADWTEA